ncbi:hypothetical protein [Brevundimonas sp. SL161]|uniref:hypothetical protein n=1 Tax=Brevundimonas sp. SL161 TaxID=2804613 RepID=UPI003CEFFD9D
MNSHYAARLRALLAESAELSDTQLLSKALIMTSVWRSKLWANTLMTLDTHVRSGPFKGMDYVVTSAEGALLPRIQGIYERELHPELNLFAKENLEAIVDIGCAEGYYAVGLALMMPGVEVYAHDIDETSRRRCGLLANANGVADRVMVGGEFRGEDFERFADRRTLVFVDAEGFEDDLLDPAIYPALGSLSVIVETHPMARPGVTERLMDRFGATHSILRIDPAMTAANIDQRLVESSHLDMALAVWEWRAGPTPWLVMRPLGWSETPTP